MVLDAWLDIGRDRSYTKERRVLLGGDHAFPGFKHCSGDGWPTQMELGYHGRAFLVRGLAVLAGAYYWTKVPRVLLFWAAFVLTRPLGATVGDFVDKPIEQGGLVVSGPVAMAVIAAFIIGCILLLPQHRGRRLRSSKAWIPSCITRLPIATRLRRRPR